MKYAIVFAVLFVVVLQEAYGAKQVVAQRVARNTSGRIVDTTTTTDGDPATPDTTTAVAIGHSRVLATSHALYGGWGNWSDYELYEECPVMCGGSTGLAFKTRSCTSPAPMNGGNACDGEDTQEKVIPCNTDACGDRCSIDSVKYHAHPTVPHNYYQCDPGRQKAFLKNCTDGTVFNVDRHTCVPPNAKHRDCFHGQVAAHPTECGKFLYCVRGQMNEMACPGGLHYCRVTKICDWPSKDNCESQ